MGISWAFLRHALFHSSFMPGLCQPMFLDFGITLAFCWHFLGILFSIFHGVELGESSTGRRARWDGIFGIFWAFSAKSSSTVCQLLPLWHMPGICHFGPLPPFPPPSNSWHFPGIGFDSLPFQAFFQISRHFLGIFLAYFLGAPDPYLVDRSSRPFGYRGN